MLRKQNLAWYPKRKLGVTMHFSEIVILQFGKKRHTLLYILLLFRIIISKKCAVTPNFVFGFHQPLLRSAFPT